jgi:hypothetical protein
MIVVTGSLVKIDIAVHSGLDDGAIKPLFRRISLLQRHLPAPGCLSNRYISDRCP